METIRDEPPDALNQAEESEKDTDEISSSNQGPQQASTPPSPEAPPLPLPVPFPLPQAHVVVLGGSFLNPSFSPNFYSTTSSLIPFFLLRALAYLSGSFGDIYLKEARRITLAMIPLMLQAEVTEITQHFFTYDLRADTERFEALYERSSLFRSSDSVRLGFAYIARSLPFTFDAPPIPPTPPPPPPTTSPTVPVPLPPSSTPLPIPTTPPTVPLTPPPPINLPTSPTPSSRTTSSITTHTTRVTSSTGISENTTEPEGQAVAKATLANSEPIADMLIILLRKPVLIWDVSGEAASVAWEIAEEQVNFYSVSSVSYRKSTILLPNVERFDGGFLEIGVVPVGMRLNYGVGDVDGVLERESSSVAAVVNRILSAGV